MRLYIWNFNCEGWWIPQSPQSLLSPRLLRLLVAAGSQGVQLMSVFPVVPMTGQWAAGIMEPHLCLCLPMEKHSKASHRVIVAGSQGMRQAGYCLNLEQEDWLTFQGCVVCLQEAQPFRPFPAPSLPRGNHFLPQWGEDLRPQRPGEFQLSQLSQEFPDFPWM